MDKVTFLSLPKQDQIRLKNTAKIADFLERKWSSRIKELIEAHTQRLIEQLIHPEAVNPMKTPFEVEGLEDLLTEQYFDVSIRSFQFAMSEHEVYSPVSPKKLARPKAPPKVPPTLKELMKQYDLFRKKKKKPKKIVAEAKKIKNEYLKRVRSVWEQHSDEFRKGNESNQSQVVKQIQKEAETTSARAQTIVRTSTTSFYNDARKSFYDQSVDITHYLFIAIRDAATSPWCTPLTTNGLRGRSGLVYAKSDPLCAKEKPATHPGCRSEYLPLSRLNPAHLRFIQNLSIQRREHKCFPLLRGWSPS